MGKLVARFQTRPNNAEMNAFLVLIGILFGSDHEIEYQEGGTVLLVEGTPEQLERLKRSMETREYPNGTASDPMFEMSVSALGGLSGWHRFLGNLLQRIVDVTIQ